MKDKTTLSGAVFGLINRIKIRNDSKWQINKGTDAKPKSKVDLSSLRRHPPKEEIRSKSASKPTPPPKPHRRRPSAAFKEMMYKHQEGRCAACKKFCMPHEMHQDHITPLASGGTNADSNFQLLCASCNCRKKAKPIHNAQLHDLAHGV